MLKLKALRRAQGRTAESLSRASRSNDSKLKIQDFQEIKYVHCPNRRGNPRLNIRVCEVRCKSVEVCPVYQLARSSSAVAKAMADKGVQFGDQQGQSAVAAAHRI